MSWFRRGRKAEATKPDAGHPQPDEDVTAAQAQDAVPDERADEVDAASAGSVDVDAPSPTASGPLDVDDVDDDVNRIDLGALQIPPREGMELRLELEEATQRVVAVTVTLGESSVQMQAFAAPRTEGIWDDIRSEIAAQVAKQGGTADEVPGTFGREVLARIPARTPDGRTGHQVARFTGVDGPRWFLRAVFNGPAAVDEAAAEDLERVVRGTVVVRGAEAMAPRDLLPLKLPQQPGGAQAGTGGSGEGEDGMGPLDPFRRGPEITEIR
ncbi:MAG TPA: DUF3710 domain-containing protein [Actinomycetales bacterium]|nr:DUF3710 domain-containing protein [Actinomycetales bacterium]